ncbi:DinB family protein [Thermoflavifilum thermophilum]|nr:DinB family protein [Thermoflavifilum thermophilum]
MDIKTLLQQDLEREFSLTHTALARVPEAHFSWKPHEKSASLGQLASHIATLPRFIMIILQEPEIDFAQAPPRRPEPPESQAALLHTFSEWKQQVLQAIQATDEKHLLQDWATRNGDTIILKGKRIQVIRWFSLHHLIHHRAELIVYLRLLNVSVPGLYGPSADEPPAWMLTK